MNWFSPFRSMLRIATSMKRADASMSDPGSRFLLVGLGNPGKEHRLNRHNVGFMAIDHLASEHGINLGRVQNKAIDGDRLVGGKRECRV